MKEFEFFVENKSVKKQRPDLNLAKASAGEGIERIAMAKSIFSSQKPKYALENAYEAVREVIDAILYLEGYKSYSHEASVAYLLKLGFSISEAKAVDRLRQKRNGIKYYGEDSTKDEATEALKTAEIIINKLLSKKQVLKLTLIVISVSVAVGAFIGGLDYVFTKIMAIALER